MEPQGVSTGLRQQAQDNLETCSRSSSRRIPEMYGWNETQPDTTADPRINLQARAIAIDCYRYIMDLCTNAGIVSDALRFVARRKNS